MESFVISNFRPDLVLNDSKRAKLIMIGTRVWTLIRFKKLQIEKKQAAWSHCDQVAAELSAKGYGLHYTLHAHYVWVPILYELQIKVE